MSLSEFEPSSCRCSACRQTCRTRPGICAPGDIERIAAYLGMPPDDPPFIQAHFKPLGGPPIDFGGDEPVNVPVIVPQQREDGSCVFLTADENCGIHPVRPFGCASCNACQGGNAAAEEACARAIAEDPEYLELWTELVYDTFEA